MLTSFIQTAPKGKSISWAGREETVDLGRPWLCPNRHILGYVKRLGSFRRLHLAEGHVLTGLADIRCPVCGSVRVWPWGEDPSHA